MTVAKKIFGVVPDQLEQRLRERAEIEGRSLSNLVSFLLETGMQNWEPPKQSTKK